MLRKLRIQNFKGWKDTGNITMAPITLFFGANSSGKSSIGQFLMMLKQTVESSDRRAVLFPGDHNTAVQLGSYQDMVFGRNIENIISFEYQWDCEITIDEIYSDMKDDNVYVDSTLWFKSVIFFETMKQKLIVSNFTYVLLNEYYEDQSIKMVCRINNKHESECRIIWDDLYDDDTETWHPGSPIRFYGFPNLKNNSDKLTDLNNCNELLFKSIYYLGPLRTKPFRLYSWIGNEPDSVGYSGENTIPALLSAKDRTIEINIPGLTEASEAKPFAEVIANSLLAMGLIHGFKVERISEQRYEYEVKIQIHGSDSWVDLPDVGFGISQVLPVLVQCYYAPPGSIIIMEQPEIHLHPSAQSALADVLIDVIYSRENGEDRNIQLIIESHSEHFLRRLQRRIAEDVIPREKVSAYFAKVVDSASTLTPLKIDQYGSIRNWPENFFGDEMGDITSQAEAAIAKRKKELAKTTGSSHV
ncbi:MAG: DUF3696 domain-containing protein [Magnetococcales bacterium]|nr:DUF3696 domain-containing protein [Magnetococcales bacterium]